MLHSNYYHEQKTHYQSLVLQQQKAMKTIAFLRLLCFLSGVGAVFFSTQANIWILLGVILVFTILFLLLLLKHSQLSEQLKRYKAYVYLYSRECDLLAYNTQAYYNGKDFLEDNHPYAKDLDIFGEHGLYPYINRAASHLGKQLLAQRLLSPLLRKTSLLTHQQSIAELQTQGKWMENFLVHTTLCEQEAPNADSSIIAWTKANQIAVPQFWHYLMPIVITANISMLCLLILGVLKPILFVMHLLIVLTIVVIYSQRITRQHQALSKQHKKLQAWQKVLAMVEQKNFETNRLKNLQQQLTQPQKASAIILKLSHLAQAFDTRLNIIGWLFLNYFLMWDIGCSLRLAKWKRNYAALISQWFKTIAEIETDVSLAMFARQDEKRIFPQIKEGNFTYQASLAYHPLMPRQLCVANDIFIDKPPYFKILTGANMAGKSTYLRTVACNLVLALAGSVVCAKHMTLSPIQIFTSIKTSDSLAKNQSYFHAELSRLQNIIYRLKKGEKLFIILDEILKGTNSKDKAEGSKALVERLIHLNTSGIIATHDLSLGELAYQFPQYVFNNCFEVDIYKDELVFDYKLRPGISQNLNANFLMRKMGIIQTNL